MGFVLVGDLLDENHQPRELCALCGFSLVFVPEEHVEALIRSIKSGKLTRQQLLSFTSL